MGEVTLFIIWCCLSYYWIGCAFIYLARDGGRTSGDQIPAIVLVLLWPLAIVFFVPFLIAAFPEYLNEQPRRKKVK